MYIKQWPTLDGETENVIIHCSRCESPDRAGKDIEELKATFKIKKVSSSICEDCAKILQAEMEAYFANEKQD